MTKKLSFVLALLLPLCAAGQNFQKYNFFEAELGRLNPASTAEDSSHVYALYKHTWSKSTGYAENPNDVAAGLALSFKWGTLSADLGYDGYSFFNRHDLKINYSYKWFFKKSKKHGRISAGGGISFGIDDINFNKLDYSGKLSGRSTYCSPDLNLGVEYCNDNIRTGLGMMNLISTSQKFSIAGYNTIPPQTTSSGYSLVRNPRVVMAYFMYRFDIKGFGLTPMVYAGYSERTEVSVGLRADWKKQFSFSYNFRAMEMVHILTLHISIPKTPLQFDVAYSGCAFYKDQSLSGGLSFRW